TGRIRFNGYLSVDDEVELISRLALTENKLPAPKLSFPGVAHEPIQVLRFHSPQEGMLSDDWPQIFHNIPFSCTFRNNLPLLQRVLSPSFGRSLAVFALSPGCRNVTRPGASAGTPSRQ